MIKILKFFSNPVLELLNDRRQRSFWKSLKSITFSIYSLFFRVISSSVLDNPFGLHNYAVTTVWFTFQLNFEGIRFQIINFEVVNSKPCEGRRSEFSFHLYKASI